MSMISEQINKIRKVAKCVYLTADKEVADDIESTLNQSADTIEVLSAKLQAVNMENGGGWRPISEYSRDKYDWVLVKYFDGEEECVPQVAELRSDGKWHVSTDFDGDYTIPSWFDVRYFFDMQQLDRS